MRRLLPVTIGLLVAIAASCTANGDPAPTAAPALPPTANANITPGPALDDTPNLVAGTALAVLESLAVDDEHVGGYDRDSWPHWDQRDDGCSVRAQVLIDESLTFAQVDPYGCAVVAGDWYSSYDGLTVSDPAEIDIDHVVPLAEAYRSGGHAWGAGERRLYANDLSDADHLIAVTSSSNRSKGGDDPFDWLPRPSDQCRYVAAWVTVKARWALSVDELERDAIIDVLTTCPSPGAANNPTEPVPIPQPTSPASTSAPFAGDPDPRFSTCKAALGAGYGPYVDGLDAEYRWYSDGDGDGVVCER